MSVVDILEIDSMIRNELSSDNIDKYIEIRRRLEKTISKTSDVKIRERITDEIKKIDSQIEDLQNEYNINFYIHDTIEFIEQYKQLLKAPKKINFMGKVCEPDNTEKNDIIKKYIIASSKYTEKVHENIFIESRCFNCGSILKFELLDDNMYICENCSVEQGLTTITSSFSDSERVNISSKYAYDRKTHFRECINQYHGKQNVNIPNKIYEDLDKKFEFHGLLNGTKDTPRKIRYSRITKKTILLFLKELGYSKHYENINLLFSVITDTPLDDISHLIEFILNDFDKLSELYDKKYADTNRKNFINTQYVLFQLLRKHGHNCDKEDFTNLKTVDRKFFHENMIKKLFQDLGWNYISIF